MSSASNALTGLMLAVYCSLEFSPDIAGDCPASNGSKCNSPLQNNNTEACRLEIKGIQCTVHPPQGENN
jgi:hypothetical protein